MAGINSLNYLKNINLSSVKETAKKTAAVTLLLSTAACSWNDTSKGMVGCLVPPAVLLGLFFFIIYASLPHGGSGGDPPTSSY